MKTLNIGYLSHKDKDDFDDFFENKYSKFWSDSGAFIGNKNEEPSYDRTYKFPDNQSIEYVIKDLINLKKKISFNYNIN